MSLRESIFDAPQPSQELQPPSTIQIVRRRARPRASHGRSRPVVERPRAAVPRSFGLAILPLALACATPPPPPLAEIDLSRRTELVEVDSRGPGRLMVRRDHQLGRYDAVLVRHVGFRYQDGQARLAERDEDRIVSMLMAAVEGGRNGAIGVAERAGDCVLAVDFFLHDLELLDLGRPAGSTAEFRRSLGRATMVLELRDSRSEALLARFVEKRVLGGGWWTRRANEHLDRLSQSIDFAVRDMGRQVGRLTPPSSAPPGGDRCRGSLADVARQQR